MVRNAQANPYADTELWWDPIALDSGAGGPIFSDAQVQQWLSDGFLVISGLWPEPLIERACTEARELHPCEQVSKDGSGFSEQPWINREDGERSPDMALK